MRHVRLAYIFPCIITLYGLTGIFRQKIRLHDPGGSTILETGMAATVTGITFVILGWLIFNIVRSYERHVASEEEIDFEPFSRVNKVLFVAWILLSVVGNLF